MANDENVKTIRFPVGTDEKLQKLADKSGLTKLAFFIHMVDYFYKSKKDPRDLNDELLKNAINKKTDNIISFIKTQEQDILLPLKKNAERVVAVQKNIVDHFNEHIIRFNDEQKAAFQTQLNQIAKIIEYLQTIDRLQYDKTALKDRFSFILESYIRAREQMAVMTKQNEKEYLIQQAREQLKSL
jgi:Asp-tRNA(Asn)/Glu-tRNA(Gln) amidotransferase C subunit